MQMVGTFGPVTLNSDTGTTTSTVNIYGVTESVTDNRNGAVTLSDRSLSPNTVPNYIWDEADTGHAVSGTMGGRQRDTGAHSDLHRAIAKIDTGVTATATIDTGLVSDAVWGKRTAGDSTRYISDSGLVHKIVEVDTGISAQLDIIQAKVDTGIVQANIVQVNSVSVQGTGDTGANDPWRPV
jgi:hypothetical protein